MRNVAVTEGDKTEAEIRFGVSVNTWGVNDLVEAVARGRATREVDDLVAEYEDLYDVVAELRPGGERHESLRYGARIELGAAVLPRGRRLQRLHHDLRGPRRPAPAARASPSSG